MEDGYILLLFQSTRKNGRDPIIGRKERGIQSDFFKQFQDERWRQSLTNEKRDERMESFFPPLPLSFRSRTILWIDVFDFDRDRGYSPYY